MIVLDACVLIGHFDARDAHHAAATALLEGACGEALVAGTVTLAEVLVGPARVGRAAEAVAALSDLGVTEIGLDAGASAALAELRAQTALKLPDCCVLAIAQAHAATLATFDDRLQAAARRLAVATIPSARP